VFKNALFTRSDFIYMHQTFSHGAAFIHPTNQQAAFASSFATAIINGSIIAHSADNVEPLIPVALREQQANWSLPWVQKLSSIGREERHASQ
jgi:hypothetical protein